MSLVSPKGHPTGPYGGVAWCQAEHDVDDIWNLDESPCTHECIHNLIENMCIEVTDERPPPSTDGISYSDLHEDMLFCFPERDMIYTWFAEDVEWLASIGYIVAVYEAEQLTHGQRQSVFDWTTARRVEELPLVR
jgi:hypothetical protein